SRARHAADHSRATRRGEEPAGDHRLLRRPLRRLRADEAAVRRPGRARVARPAGLRGGARDHGVRVSAAALARAARAAAAAFRGGRGARSCRARAGIAMILLIVVAAVLAVGTVWFLARAVRSPAVALTPQERQGYEQLRDRLLAQLRELDVEEGDRNVDAGIASDERRRLEAELA